MLQWIRKKYPNVDLSMVTKENVYPFIKRIPFIDNAYVFNKKLKDKIALVKSLWHQDLVFCADTFYRILLIYVLQEHKNEWEVLISEVNT